MKKRSSPMRSTFKSPHNVPQYIPSNLAPGPLNTPRLVPKALLPGCLNVLCCLLDNAVDLGPLDILYPLNNTLILAHALVSETKLLRKKFIPL